MSESKQSTEDVIRSKLGPVIFKIGLQQHTIKWLFQLFKKFFNVIDSNGSGQVSKNEVGALANFGMFPPNAIRRLKSFDTNTNGKIDFGEFVTFCLMEFIQDLEVEKLFDSLDTDKSGKISAGEIDAAVQAGKLDKIHSAFKGVSASDVVSFLDADGDALVEREEFAAGLTKLMFGYVAKEKEVELPEKLVKKLAPLAFRLVTAHDKLKTICELFQKLFAAFDSNSDGQIEAKEAKVFVDAGFFEEGELEWLDNIAKDGKVTFTQFISFWVQAWLADEAKNKEAVLAKVGPVLVQLNSMTSTISHMFRLYKSIFSCFDGDGSGFIESKEMEALNAMGLVSDRSIASMAKNDVDKDKRINFAEFLTFIAGDLLQTEFEMTEVKSKDYKPIPNDLRKALEPLSKDLVARERTARKLFKLLVELFKCFDADKSGTIDRKELSQLYDVELLTDTQWTTLKQWPCKTKGRVSQDEFLSFFCHYYVNEIEEEARKQAEKNRPRTEEEIDAIRSKLAGLAFRLRGQQDNFRAVYNTVKALFECFDIDSNGLVSLKEIAELKILDTESVQRLLDYDRVAANNRKDSKISLSEFWSFVSDELVRNEGFLM